MPRNNAANGKRFSISREDHENGMVVIKQRIDELELYIVSPKVVI